MNGNGQSQAPTKYSTFIDNENYESEGAPLCNAVTKKHSRFTYSQPPLPSPSATLPPPEGEEKSRTADIRHIYITHLKI